jgi:hypothetical protein
VRKYGELANQQMRMPEADLRRRMASMDEAIARAVTNPTRANVAVFPPLDLVPSDDLGPNLAFATFPGYAKASVTLEMLRSGTYGGKTCALILVKVSFLYTKDSRLQNATIKVTVSAPTGTNQAPRPPPSLARIAPETARGPQTQVQRSSTRQRGLGLTTTTSAPMGVSGSASYDTTYTTYTSTRITSMITCSGDPSIQDRAEFIFQENPMGKAGIPTSLVAGLIVLSEPPANGDNNINIAVGIHATQGWGRDLHRDLVSRLRGDKHRTDTQAPFNLAQNIAGLPEWERQVQQLDDLDLDELVKSANRPKVLELAM